MNRALGWAVCVIALGWVSACESVTKPKPEVLSINPSRVSTLSDTEIVIKGRNFLTRAHSAIDSGEDPEIDTAFEVELEGPMVADYQASFVDTETLTVVIQAGLQIGVYDLTVTTPDGARASLDAALVVVGPSVSVSIDDAPLGSGSQVIGPLNVTTDDSLSLFAAGRDAIGNWVEDLEVTWGLDTNIGTLAEGPATSTTVELTTPGSGTVSISHPLLGGAEVTLAVIAGAPFAVHIETTPGGLGEKIGSMRVSVGSDVSMYAVGYDVDGNYAGEVEVEWAVTGNIGIMDPATLAAQSVFEPRHNGVGQVVATPITGVGDSTGNITVIGGTATQVKIEDRASGLGSEVGTLALTTDDALQFFAVSRDEGGNFVANVSVTWSWDTSCADLGGLSTTSGSSVVFDASILGTCRLVVQHPSLAGDQTGDITVGPGALAKVVIETSESGGTLVGTLNLVSGGADCTAGACNDTCGRCALWAVGYDADGHRRGTEVVDWSVVGDIGTCAPASGTSTVFIAGHANTGYVKADVPGFGSSSDAQTGIITVEPGTPAAVFIESAADGSGTEVSRLQVLSGGSVVAHAVVRDAAGNFVADCDDVTWTVSASGCSVAPTPACSTTIYSAGGASSGTLTASKTGVGSDGVDVEVNPGTIAAVYVTENAALCRNWSGGQRSADEQITLYAVGCSDTGQVLTLIDSDPWSITGDTIGELMPTSGSSTTVFFNWPGTGQVQAVSLTEGSASTGPVEVVAGSLYAVRIEDAPGDGGGEVDTADLVAGASQTFYAVGRDEDGNFTGDESVAWLLSDAIGSLEEYGSRVVLHAERVGSAVLIADHATALSDSTGEIMVSAGDLQVVSIEDKPDGEGAFIDDRTLTADDQMQVYAVGRDAWGNFARNIDVTWALEGDDIGYLEPENPQDALLHLTTVGEGSIVASYDVAGFIGTSGVISVVPGALHHVVIEWNSGDPIDEVFDHQMYINQSISLHSVGRDEDGNFVQNANVTWSMSDAIGTLPDGSTATATFTATNKGTTVITATHPTVSDDSTGVIEVLGFLCGNQIIEGDEVCDGFNLGGETCLSQGFRQGTGSGLACNADCSAFLIDGCLGGRIDDWEQVIGAVEDSYATLRHDVISLHATNFIADQPLVIDECTAAGGCGGIGPYGVTLRPLHDQVRILSEGLGSPTPLIDILSGNNAIFGMTMEVNTTAISIAAGPEAGANTISHNQIVAVAPLTSAALIEVESDANLIEANALLGPQMDHADTGISVEEAAGNHIAMNVIVGPFLTGVKVSHTGSGSGNVTKIDHNSIYLLSTEGNTGTGVLLDTVPKLCYRNNIVYRTATGLSLTSVSLASDGECDGFAAGRNVNGEYLDRCVSSDVPSSLCMDLCGSPTAPRPMCDVDANPMWSFDDAFLCLHPDSGLINEGEDVKWDMWDAPGTPDYYEHAPEIGAREFGVQRSFGGQISICE